MLGAPRYKLFEWTWWPADYEEENVVIMHESLEQARELAREEFRFHDKVLSHIIDNEPDYIFDDPVVIWNFYGG